MKVRFLVLAGLAAVALLLLGPPVWFHAKRVYGNWQEAEQQRAADRRATAIRRQNERPPAALDERPGDRKMYPRSSFAVSYHDANGFAVDTAVGTVTQDRIMDPDTTFSMQLTTAQIDTLYELALHDQLFEMPEPARLYEAFVGASHWSGILTLSSRSVRHSLHWGPWTRDEVWSDDHKRLNSYVQELQRMVKSSAAYVALPGPRGVYID